MSKLRNHSKTESFRNWNHCGTWGSRVPKQPQSRLEAADRVTLLMSFVPFLLEYGPVSVSQLADHFEITEHQVDELIQLLAMSGIPGDSGSYQHSDLFDINWDLYESERQVELWSHIAVESTPRLSTREAATIVAGLQYISGLVPVADQAVVNQLLNKIATGASALPENISVATAVPPFDLGVLKSAVNSQTPVTFTYRKRTGGDEERTVDPLRVDVIGSQWYLRAWCHARNEVRAFRLDRMSKLRVSPKKFVSLVTAEELPVQLFAESPADTVVQFRIPANIFPLLSNYHPTVSSTLPDNHLLIEVRFADLSTVPLFVALAAGHIHITEPLSAQLVVQDWANQALARYSR